MNNPQRLFVQSLALVLITGGCATMSPEECAVADWELLGLQDGRSGKSHDYLARRAEDCAEAGYSVNRDAWMRGWENGVVDFCTPERGFREGLEGDGYHHLCPGELEAEFLSGYEPGRDIHQAEDRLERTRNRIDSAEERLSELREADRRELDREAIDETQARLKDLHEQLREDELRLERARGIAEGRGFRIP